MLNILFPKRPLSAGMNGITLLFLLPLIPVSYTHLTLPTT